MNVPNLLSISRILAVPVFIVLMLEPTPLRALLAGSCSPSPRPRTGSTDISRENGGRLRRSASCSIPSRTRSWLPLRSLYSWTSPVSRHGSRSSSSARDRHNRPPCHGRGRRCRHRGREHGKVEGRSPDYCCALPGAGLPPGTDWISDVGRIAIFIAMILAVISGIQYIIDYWKRAR